MVYLAPLTFVTAFSNSAFGGNPAAVVFLHKDLPDDILRKIAKNMNQPITCYISASLSPSPDEKSATFRIRFFVTLDAEVSLCGHGVLAAAKAVFDNPNLVTDKVEVIHFETVTRGVMKARKLDGGFIEIQLPSAMTEEVVPTERARLASILHKAFGRDLKINYIGKGGRDFEQYLLVELDEKENLSQCTVDASALHDTGFDIHTVTTASSSDSELFVSRMFASALKDWNGEDQVCGSAHCLMAPYWYNKKGISGSQEIKAKQVSPRGGELRLIWEESEGILKLAGELTVVATGNLHL